MEGLFSLQFVCVSVCPALLLNKIPANWNAPIWMRFSVNGCLSHWLWSYWDWLPWVKGQGHSDSIFFLHNFLLTSLLYISALLCLIKLKFGMPLRYALGNINFIKIKRVMTSLYFLYGNKVQYNKQHLMTSAFWILTKGQGHTIRSKITDVEMSAFSECFLFV